MAPVPETVAVPNEVPAPDPGIHPLAESIPVSQPGPTAVPPGWASNPGGRDFSLPVEEASSSKKWVLAGLGVVVFIVGAVSVWWFALRVAPSPAPEAATAQQKEVPKSDKPAPFGEGVAATPAIEPPAVEAHTGEQSFDCKKATTGHEKAVCGDPELAAADREMYKAFLKKRSSLTGVELETFQAGHQIWIQTFADTCQGIPGAPERKNCILTGLNSYAASLVQ
jgi:uncharacterized protein YecT (DUF1311 family)